jgi:hypothetical protein
VIIVRSSRKVRRVLCKACSGAVSLVSLDEAVKISGLSARAIYRLIEQGSIHFEDTAEGNGLICPITLLESSRYLAKHQ